MDISNITLENEFFLTGFMEWQAFWPLIFLLFLILYLFTLLANTGLLTLIFINLHLYTPMYIFLCNLSFLDLCYSSTIVPKTLIHFISTSKTISFGECATQMFFFATFGTSEVYLLAAMAYDRYMAICFPLHYSILMNKHICFCLLASCYAVGLLQSSIIVSCIIQLHFCTSRIIDHYFCDVPPILKLACSDITFTEILIYVFGGIAEAGSLLVIVSSYCFILSTILRIHSFEGRQKAFSTCGSHFACVTLFYSTVVFMYFRPSSSHSNGQERLISIVYTTVIPAVNPLIYSIRNTEVKGALSKLLKQ